MAGLLQSMVEYSPIWLTIHVRFETISTSTRGDLSALLDENAYQSHGKALLPDHTQTTNNTYSKHAS